MIRVRLPAAAVALLGLALSLAAAGCTHDSATSGQGGTAAQEASELGSGQNIEDLDIAKFDRLRSEPWPSDPTRISGAPASIKWRQIGHEFDRVTAVSLRPDGAIYVIDDGDLYFSDGLSDTWSQIDDVDASRGCIADTATAAIIAGSESGFYLEVSAGEFEYVDLPFDGEVGCSFAKFGDDVWGTSDGDTAFVMLTGTPGTSYRETSLQGPSVGPDQGLVMRPAQFWSTSPPSVLIEGVASSGLRGNDEVWRWWIDTDDLQPLIDGVPGTADFRTVGSFSSWSASTEVMSLSGGPGMGYATRWSGPSKAVLRLGPEAAQLNSLWPIPRHFVEVDETVLAFGVMTSMGTSEIDSVLWRLTSYTWEQFRGAGPGTEGEPQIVHHVAASGDTLVAATCAPNSADCGLSDSTTLWLGVVFDG